jgi:hypothetical protein
MVFMSGHSRPIAPTVQRTGRDAHARLSMRSIRSLPDESTEAAGKPHLPEIPEIEYAL